MAALVSPIVEIILRLWTCCAKHTRYLRKLQQNMILLSTAMDELKEARDDVQRKVVEEEADLNEPKKRTDPVRGWLERVQIIEGDVENILQNADEQLSRARCLGGCCSPNYSPNYCWSNYKVGKLIAKKIQLVNVLKGNRRFEELTYILPPSHVKDMNLESTVGMESMFDKVWRLVTNTDVDKPVRRLRIMGLYGQGGVGKTTLLKQINKEFHKINGEHGFDYVVIFVLVSKPVIYEDIQKTIGEKLGLSNSLQGDGDEDSRAQKIFNALSNKNYVLLLDDIWEEVDKKRIGIPIHPQGNSKLIFTTRSERVCGEMKADKKFKVECLPRDEAWRLFKENLGEEALNYFPGACGLAKVVAEECDGLPLAIIALGKAMSTKKSVHEWNDAVITLRRYASELKDMREKVLPSLQLSYDYLHNETEKSCFRYCSLYPEDYSIEITQLVDIWIAEGLLSGFDNLSAARSRGHTIIGSLKSACLLESSGEYNRKKTHVKMHDVIRDLALWIVNDCISSDESGNNSNNKYLVAVNGPCNKWKNAERIFWDADRTTSSISNEEENPPTSLNLLTLIVHKKVFDVDYFFQDMPRLRVLDLSNHQLSSNRALNDEFPIISICKLLELQYLKLTGMFIKELPVELRKLVKLKFLVLKNTYRLRRIPAGVIANLSELQVLDLGCVVGDGGFEDWELECGLNFSELDGLKQLQEVRITITSDVALENFLCNRKLQMVCTGLMFISSSPLSGRVLDLSKFKCLKDLELYGRATVVPLLSERLESLLEELVLFGSTTDGGLLSNLETLSLRRFPKLNSILWKTTQPRELLRSHFQSLHSIDIDGCDALKDLTWLVYVHNLKDLSVKSCYGLETIIEFGDDGLEGGDQISLNTGGGGGEVFRRLTTLQMLYLPKLKSICRHALAFPFIETIWISQCPELKKLPLGSGSNVNNTLKVIEGEEEWWNELQWEDETIKSKFLPYLNKPIYDDPEDDYLLPWID